jgi:tetratricopeptide (TPR) repeat protein
VRYVLEGSVQCRGDRMRVNVQLIDADTGSHLWAERFNKTIADLFDLQDEIVARLANQLAAELIAVEARRAARAPHPDSMDRYFQGQAKLHEGRSPAQLAVARSFFEQALALDGGNLEALVGRAFVDFMAGSSHMADDREVRLQAAEASLVQALRAAPAHGLALTLLGAVHIVTNRADEGIAECQRALALDRNLAIAHSFVALAKSYVGRSGETEADMLEALRLSPRDINVFIWLFCVGLAKLCLGADQAAVDWCQRSIETNRNFPLSHFVLAAALAALGRQGEAQMAVASGLALDPSFTIERYRQGAASDHPVYLAQRERIYQLMGLAGVPLGGS